MLERYRSGHNGADSKSVCEQSHGGSNPPLSANKDYTVGVFYPKKNLNKSLIENAVKKLHDFIIENKIINQKNEKNEFEKWNFNNDDAFSIINTNTYNEKFVNWRKYFNE